MPGHLHRKRGWESAGNATSGPAKRTRRPRAGGASAAQPKPYQYPKTPTPPTPTTAPKSQRRKGRIMGGLITGQYGRRR